MLSKNAEEKKLEFAARCSDSPRDKFDIAKLAFEYGYDYAQDEAKAEIESIKAEFKRAKVQIAVLNHVRDTLTRAIDKAVEALQKDDEVGE